MRATHRRTRTEPASSPSHYSCNCRSIKRPRRSYGISTAGRRLRTRHAIPAALESGKKIVVPYCTVDDFGANKLGLWWLQKMDELVVGKWNILEPPRDRWEEPGKVIQPEQLDLVIVPGVGFSRGGARMGNGQGYYDRLLNRVRPDCPLVALCYECQLFDNLIVGPHDVFMDKVVTERAAYEGRGRSVSGRSGA